METSLTRRRNIENISQQGSSLTSSSKIYEDLFLIACLRSDMPIICDALSMSLRVAALADLAFDNLLDINNDVVIVKEGVINDPILDEIYNKIRIASFNLRDMLISLNGESFKSKYIKVHVKRLRDKISKKLEEEGKIRYENKKFGLRKGRPKVDENVKIQLSCKIVSYLNSRDFCLRTEVLIACLIYCNGVKPLLFSVPQNKVAIMRTKLENIRKRYVEAKFINEPPDRIIYGLLKTLFKL
ncbi:hypothetical protein EDEG_00743 [Edhazardia aedis USNM 41457]|uniref:Uncharacterized protein n=1 Tax=Edhazardia aedis (strain USNM 41457) TaxID=1003232 RepID=J9DV47_EDHAE|nr:hypothetical protein EDEG_00743 [Edhazardia aedis USNM 41457]|eukprot:EJW05162.1 hypothetical protein EDEG_00743 [Edhazardia aedis USNM 41457]